MATRRCRFAARAFRYAMCADAFMFICDQAKFVGELQRLVDIDRTPGTVVISHTHNARVWSQSHGNPLPPEGYLDLFETQQARLSAAGGLSADVVGGGPMDLSRRDPPEALDRDPALVIVASSTEGSSCPILWNGAGCAWCAARESVYSRSLTERGTAAAFAFIGELRRTSLARADQYLPDEVVLEQAALTRWQPAGASRDRRACTPAGVLELADAVLVTVAYAFGKSRRRPVHRVDLDAVIRIGGDGPRASLRARRHSVLDRK